MFYVRRIDDVECKNSEKYLIKIGMIKLTVKSCRLRTRRSGARFRPTHSVSAAAGACPSRQPVYNLI